MRAPAGLTINRLRCPLPARQPVVARLALEALAAEVADVPAGQPPQSLLVVRQLALEVPGLSLARLPDSGQRLAAGRGAGSLLADAWAQAAQPAHGPVPAQANAVRFGDPAELLACIARDGLTGGLDRWWWHALLGTAFPDWRQAWGARPEAIPAALRLLAREGLESAVRQALDAPAAVIAVTEFATMATAAPAVPAARAGRTAGAMPPMPSPERPATTADGAPAGHRASPAEPTAPAPPSPAAEAGQPPPARARLLPAAAARARPPATPPTGDPPPSAEERSLAAAPPALSALVTPAFAADASPPGRAATTAAAAPSRPSEDACTPPAADPAGQPAAAVTDFNEAAARASPTVPYLASGAERTARSALAQSPSANPAARLSAEIGRLLAVGHSRHRPPSAPASRTEAVLAPITATDAMDAPGRLLDATPIPVRSGHARLFFLVNLLLGDGLYPDFTQPATAGFPVPIWRLLALLGSGLAGPALRDDPLWPLLNRLADELPPGEDCAFLRDWPIPPASPPRHGTPRGDRSGLATVPPERRPHTLRHARPQGFARWLAAYRHSLRQRLAAALDLPPALLGRAFVQEESAALIWVSAAEIVVVQPLDEHPVAWRLAGLDRDPGFLPSAGRSLRFIFQ